MRQVVSIEKISQGSRKGTCLVELTAQPTAVLRTTPDIESLRSEMAVMSAMRGLRQLLFIQSYRWLVGLRERTGCRRA